MKLFSMFSIGADKILAKNHSVSAVVSLVRDSYLYVIKKPVRIGITEENTKCSHIIHFTYTVDGTSYRGELFISPYYRCPQKGDTIDVYYDPEKPQNYACYAFGPGVPPTGWRTMLRYKCLVLDHDDTVVQSMKTLSYPFFCQELEYFRPGASMTLEDYILQCHKLGFARLCRERFGFTDAEMKLEHDMWMEYILSHIPAPYPGIDRIIMRQKEAGGILCVVSHSHVDNILRDYDAHFGTRPDSIYGWELPPEHQKPNPWPLEDIMRRYDLRPEDILVVDDMQLACKMAEPVGVPVAYAGWSGMGVPEVEAEMKALCRFSFDTIDAFEAFLFEKE